MITFWTIKHNFTNLKNKNYRTYIFHETNKKSITKNNWKIPKYLESQQHTSTFLNNTWVKNKYQGEFRHILNEHKILIKIWEIHGNCSKSEIYNIKCIH